MDNLTGIEAIERKMSKSQYKYIMHKLNTFYFKKSCELCKTEKSTLYNYFPHYLYIFYNVYFSYPTAQCPYRHKKGIDG